MYCLLTKCSKEKLWKMNNDCYKNLMPYKFWPKGLKSLAVHCVPYIEAILALSPYANEFHLYQILMNLSHLLLSVILTTVKL